MSRKVALFCPFSLWGWGVLSFSSYSAAGPRSWSFFSDDSEGGSSVYRHALKFQRPTTIKWQEHLYNSVSFIGSVDLPVQRCSTKNGRLGLHTILKVKNSSESDRTFRILLKMWGRMAAKSLPHLRPNDFIHVSGQLGSYTKVDASGNLRAHYEVIVKEWNYVSQNFQHQTCQQYEKLNQVEKVFGGTDREKKNRLHLWQVFFANPHEWWDNRQKKFSPTSPDFRHKDTSEALWLSPHDPPWVKRQLELYDSKMAEQGQRKYENAWSHMSMWVSDD